MAINESRRNHWLSQGSNQFSADNCLRCSFLSLLALFLGLCLLRQYLQSYLDVGEEEEEEEEEEEVMAIKGSMYRLVYDRTTSSTTWMMGR